MTVSCDLLFTINSATKSSIGFLSKRLSDLESRAALFPAVLPQKETECILNEMAKMKHTKEEMWSESLLYYIIVSSDLFCVRLLC